MRSKLPIASRSQAQSAHQSSIEHTSRATASLVRPPAWVNGLPLQPKLTVNQPGDRYEHEADQVAEQIMRMPAPGLQRCDCGGPARLDGECEACKARRLALQRKGDSMGGSEAPQSVHQTLNRPGQPLDDSTRDFMESRFGTDFSGVRVHTDSQAAQSVGDVSALAYTVGSDIVFGSGQYAPGTEGGKSLLAHELTHVVQQQDDDLSIQRMLACPATLHGPTPPGWQSYHGDSSVFHCGYRGILEDRSPTRDDPQNECFYDHSGVLVDENHPFSGCGGTPNQYDSSEHPILHTLIDSGGIVRAGVPAFADSRIHDAAGWLAGFESAIKRLYGVP
jgi:Domain of unknown function (DUF4157)